MGFKVGNDYNLDSFLNGGHIYQALPQMANGNIILSFLLVCPVVYCFPQVLISV